MSSFKPTQLVFKKAGQRLTPDDLRWKGLEAATLVEETGQVSHLSFCPVKPYALAVTASAKVGIYSPASVTEERALSRFKSAARGAVWRADGALLAAGDDQGVVRVFAPGGESSSTSALRLYKGHSGPVHRAAFLPDQHRLASASDDKTLRVWDLGRSDGRGPVAVLRGHSDYVRSLAAGAADANRLLSAAYDHSACLWDLRTESMTAQMLHGAPVECAVMFPNERLLATAAGTLLSVWDARKIGAKPLLTRSRHSKTITQLCFATGHSRLLSASLDATVKWYDSVSWEVVHTERGPGPLLSLAVAPEDRYLAMGVAGTRTLAVRRRPEPKEATSSKRPSSLRPGDLPDSSPSGPKRRVVREEEKERLERHDHLLRQFRHADALDSLLRNKYTAKLRPEMIVSLMLELSRRGALGPALAGRDAKGLRLVTDFLAANLAKPRFNRTLVAVAQLLVGVYAEGFADLDPDSVAAFRKLSCAVEWSAEAALLSGLVVGALGHLRHSVPQ